MVKNTLALVRGVEVQQLIPFLSNPRIVMATSGGLAQIPPTLLAPIGFPGAHLKFLKINQKTIGAKEDAFSCLEIEGPILPNTVNSLCELFRSTVGNFKVHLHDYEYTNSFSAYNSIVGENSGVLPLFATESLKDCGFSATFIHDLCLQERQAAESTNSIIASQGHFQINHKAS